MALYTTDSKDRVRDAVDMVDLVSSRTELRKAGANRFTGLCPFHDERTPSFGINPLEKVYYCFGCQAKGDAFTFVMETEGVDFKGALELLADRYNVPLELEQEDPREAEKRQRSDRLLELLERTAAFYVRHLWESDEAERARVYLAERGLEEGTLRAFRVGYAPSAWDTVLNASRRAKYANREVFDVGLAQKAEKSGKLYDRFRSQIIFPLADPRGRVRGFAGRHLGGDGDRRPKYINSPENELFHKRSQLFGADLARAAAAKAGFVVAAEGYTDVIAMHQAGLRNCVGIMGTALTDEQIDGLARLAPEVRLALDADSAGQEAMLRAARVALGRSVPLRLRVVALPPGEDPADLVKRTGADEIQRLVADSAPFVRFRVLHTLETGDLGDAEGRDRVSRQLTEIFSLLAPSAEREELRRIAADRLDLSPELLERVLPRGGGAPNGSPAGGGAGAAAGAQASAGERRDGAHPSAVLGRREPTERSFLALCIALPALGAPALAELDLEADLTSNLTRRAAAHLREQLATPTAGLDDDDPLLGFMRELAVGDARAAPPTTATFEIERLQLALARLDREIAGARAAAAGDISELARRRSQTQVELSKAVERAMDEGTTRG
ncbi:MAG: primase [bacterium]